MPERDTETRAEVSAQLLRERVEDKGEAADAAAAPSAQRDPLAHVSCRSGDAACASAHARTLDRATDSQPAKGRHALMRLQRQYGNRFVERVMSLASKGATVALPEAGDTIQTRLEGDQAEEEKKKEQEPMRLQAEEEKKKEQAPV